MRVRTLATITTPQGTIPPGEIVSVPDAVLDRLRGKVEMIADTPRTVLSSASCRIDGDTCRIRYTPDLYRASRHRDGEIINIEGVPLTLRIEEITI